MNRPDTLQLISKLNATRETGSLKHLTRTGSQSLPRTPSTTPTISTSVSSETAGCSEPQQQRFGIVTTATTMVTTTTSSISSEQPITVDCLPFACMQPHPIESSRSVPTSPTSGRRMLLHRAGGAGSVGGGGAAASSSSVGGFTTWRTNSASGTYGEHNSDDDDEEEAKPTVDDNDNADTHPRSVTPGVSNSEPSRCRSSASSVDGGSDSGRVTPRSRPRMFSGPGKIARISSSGSRRIHDLRRQSSARFCIESDVENERMLKTGIVVSKGLDELAVDETEQAARKRAKSLTEPISVMTSCFAPVLPCSPSPTRVAEFQKQCYSPSAQCVVRNNLAFSPSPSPTPSPTRRNMLRLPGSSIVGHKRKATEMSGGGAQESVSDGSLVGGGVQPSLMDVCASAPPPPLMFGATPGAHGFVAWTTHASTPTTSAYPVAVPMAFHSLIGPPSAKRLAGNRSPLVDGRPSAFIFSSTGAVVDTSTLKHSLSTSSFDSDVAGGSESNNSSVDGASILPYLAAVRDRELNGTAGGSGTGSSSKAASPAPTFNRTADNSGGPGTPSSVRPPSAAASDAGSNLASPSACIRAIHNNKDAYTDNDTESECSLSVTDKSITADNSDSRLCVEDIEMEQDEPVL